MRKLVNDPFAVVDEMVEGVARAFPSQIEVTPGGRGIVATRRAEKRRVGIVFGGGSGHEPAFFGYVGPGLANGAALGNVFASPSAGPIVEVAERVNRHAGVLFLYGNYEGDVMNFDMASELSQEHRIATLHVAVTDDVASASAWRGTTPRGRRRRLRPEGRRCARRRGRVTRRGRTRPRRTRMHAPGPRASGSARARPRRGGAHV